MNVCLEDVEQEALCKALYARRASQNMLCRLCCVVHAVLCRLWQGKLFVCAAQLRLIGRQTMYLVYLFHAQTVSLSTQHPQETKVLASRKSSHTDLSACLHAQVEALLDRTGGEAPLIGYVVGQFEALGYHSWAHRVISSAGGTKRSLTCTCHASKSAGEWCLFLDLNYCGCNAGDHAFVPFKCCLSFEACSLSGS